MINQDEIFSIRYYLIDKFDDSFNKLMIKSFKFTYDLRDNTIRSLLLKKGEVKTC